jgi:DNA-binding MarR family transcriptional regulator
VSTLTRYVPGASWTVNAPLTATRVRPRANTARSEHLRGRPAKIGPTQLLATWPLTETCVLGLLEPQLPRAIALTAASNNVPILDCPDTCLYAVAVTDGDESIDAWSLPALLRAARGAYRSAIRGDLDEAGLDDVPRNGIYVIGAIARTEAPLSEIIEQLGVSKQAAGALVDTLVTRGYLERSIDQEDRRRLRVTLTERGEAAAVVVRAAVERVDTALVARVGPEYVAHTRATLASLISEDHLDA